MLALSFSEFDPQETSTGIWLSRDYRRSIISRFPSGTLACSARCAAAQTLTEMWVMASSLGIASP